MYTHLVMEIYEFTNMYNVSLLHFVVQILKFIHKIHYHWDGVRQKGDLYSVRACSEMRIHDEGWAKMHFGRSTDAGETHAFAESGLLTAVGHDFLLQFTVALTVLMKIFAIHAVFWYNLL